jgi:DNA helicase IV
MKHYIPLFESFEESFDDFYQKPNPKSDSFYHTVSKELIELANQYMENPSKIDPYSEKYETPSRIMDLQNDLIVEINDTASEDLAQEFADESDSLLQSYEVSEMNKKEMFAKDNEIPDNEMVDKEVRRVEYSRPGKKITLRPARTHR